MKKAVLSLVLVFVLFGCGTTKGIIQKDDQESLAKSSDLYYKLIMWKSYDKAAKFVDPEKHKQFESFVLANREDLNITGYEIKEMTFITEGKPDGSNKEMETSVCKVRVLYTYYKYPSVSERSVMAKDTWIKIGKFWYISSDFNEGTFK
ncbi:MAG: hypothetical protein ACHQ6U_04655 [Thermodesulfobacteriota bacterium]